MTVSTPLDFDTIVNNMVTEAQSSSSAPIAFSEGSPLLALLEGAAGGGVLWLQALIYQLLQTTRASTCVGEDLDSWMEQFKFYRLGAVSSKGTATFARFTATFAATVSVGQIVETADATQQFAAIADTTNTHFNATTQQYTIPSGITSLGILCQAVTPGAAGNVPANAITTFASPITYVDTVNNASAFTGGEDEESDDAFRARFVLYVVGLARATEDAIAGAIAGVQQGLTFSLTENYDSAGNFKPGYFYAVIDDGTGATPSGTVTAVYNAVLAVRGFTVGFGVFAASKVAANIVYSVQAAAGYDHTALENTINSALATFLNSFPVANDLAYLQLPTVIATASPGVVAVLSVTLNGGTSNLNATNLQVIRAGTISGTAT